MHRLFETGSQVSRRIDATAPPTRWTTLCACGVATALGGLLVVVQYPPLFTWLKPMAAVVGVAGAMLAVVAGRRALRHGPSVVSADDSGIVSARGLTYQRVWWGDVLGIEIGDDGATLRTARGTWAIPSYLEGWRSVAAAVVARVQQGGQPIPTLDPSGVLAWLGVPCVHYDRWPQSAPFAAGIAAAALLGLMTVPVAKLHTFGLGAALILGGMQAWTTWRARERSCVIAAASGLVRGTGRRSTRACGWGDVVNVERVGARWVIDTAAGRFSLRAGDANAAIIAATAQHVLDARAQGLTMPRLVGVSDAALSPAEPSVKPERGLSGAAGPE